MASSQSKPKSKSQIEHERWLTWLNETLAICRQMQHRAAIAYHVRALLKEADK